MKKEIITSIIGYCISLLLALFLVVYTFVIVKDIRTKTISEVVLYVGVTIVIHQVLMRVRLVHTIASDVVCMLANVGFTMIGALGSVISGLYLLKAWVLGSMDQELLIMFIVCLVFLFYSLKLLPEKFRLQAEE